MTDLKDFVDKYLTPAVFKHADKVLYWMHFTKYKGGWRSPYTLDQSSPHTPRADKCVITPKYPYLVLEQGGETKSIISLYKEFNRCPSWLEAAKGVAEIVGIDFPEMGDSENYRRYREKQDKLETLAASMRRALYSPEGSSALQYLKNQRGYDDGFIEYGEFGYCSREAAEKLSEILSDEESTYISNKVGNPNSLAIPYRTEGHIMGFVFRNLGSAGSKYVDVFISKKATKRHNLFGFTSLIPISSEEWDKSIVIVEGEIDAMRANYMGLTNVVAASGGSISEEVIKEAKKIGATTIKLLFDRGEQGTEKKIREAAKTIQYQGLRPYVAILPQEKEGEKVDVDSYLRDHTGEDLRELIKYAHPLCVWEMLQMKEEVDRLEHRGELQNSTYEESKRRTIKLMTDPNTTPTDRNLIANLFSHLWEGIYQITEEAIQEEAQRVMDLEAKSLQKSETLSALSEAYRMTEIGQVGEALNLLQEKLPRLTYISSEADFAKLLKTPRPNELRSKLSEKPQGIKTEYFFGQGEQQEQLILPAGALTFICAPTSHGKSRMLQNLTLQVMRSEGEGDVLYFSYEEDPESVTTQILNCFINENISANNLRTINSFYRGEGNYIRADKRALFQQKEEEFMQILAQGKLRIYHEDFDSKRLASAIRYICKNTKVKAVMVDYIQLLRTKGSRLLRKDELKEICKDLMSLSIEIKKPLLLAAQLNREAYSPVEMSVQNITEASDIEHSANIVLLLWNSNVKPLPKSSGYFIDKGKESKLSKDAQRLESMGFKIGEEGKIYCVLAKNRGGRRNIEAVLDYNGNTGRITQPKEQIASLSANLSQLPIREDDDDNL